MVNDVLQNSKEFVKSLDFAILESSNAEFRQLITNLRNSAEIFDSELQKISESKGYYYTSSNVDENEIKKNVFIEEIATEIQKIKF